MDGRDWPISVLLLPACCPVPRLRTPRNSGWWPLHNGAWRKPLQATWPWLRTEPWILLRCHLAGRRIDR